MRTYRCLFWDRDQYKERHVKAPSFHACYLQLSDQLKTETFNAEIVRIEQIEAMQ